MARKRFRQKGCAGFSLPELLVVIALVGIFLMVAAVDLSSSVRRKDFENFAQEVVELMERCRWKALNERRYAGLIFENQDDSFQVSLYQDRNGNGIRTEDVRNGDDVRIYGPVNLIRSSGDLQVGILNSGIPQIPPRAGVIDRPEDPIKFGRADIISFSPMGDSSSGTLYLACRSQKQMYGIVVYGATARLTLWRFSNHQWQMVGDR
jgi:prepilin-type N-terminal cleavage/methylation domain-containing protein